jgi:hypothetical protein
MNKLNKKGEESIVMRLVLSIVIVIIVLFFAIKYNITGKVILEIPNYETCSEDSIKSIWASLFKGNPENIRIFMGANYNKCDNFLAFDIKGNNVEMIISSFVISEQENSKGEKVYINISLTTGIYGNFSEDYISILRNITGYNGGVEQVYIIPDYLTIKKRTLSEAKTEFSTRFKTSSEKWKLDGEGDYAEYKYTELDYSPSSKKYNIGSVTSNYYYGQLDLGKFHLAEIDSENMTCRPRWTQKETPCTGKEFKTIYYQDANGCSDQTKKPEDIQERCDFNNDGLYGHPTTIKTNIKNINLFIDDKEYDLNKNYLDNVNHNFKLKDENGKIITEFDILLKEKLDLEKIYIQKQEMEKIGYTIINGLNTPKDIYTDKLNEESKYVCLKNAEITTLSSISLGCNASDEIKLQCPGKLSIFSCEIENNRFKVSGLSKSAVMEFLEWKRTENNNITLITMPQNNTSQICNSNWSCTSWSSCEKDIKIRTCEDKNKCAIHSKKPQEIASCNKDCTPLWICSEWDKSQCDSTGLKIRTCEDKNNCFEVDIPEEEKKCDTTNELKKTIIIGLVIFIVLIVIFVIIMLTQEENKKKDEQPLEIFLDKNRNI